MLKSIAVVEINDVFTAHVKMFFSKQKEDNWMSNLTLENVSEVVQ